MVKLCKNLWVTASTMAWETSLPAWAEQAGGDAVGSMEENRGV